MPGTLVPQDMLRAEDVLLLLLLATLFYLIRPARLVGYPGLRFIIVQNPSLKQHLILRDHG
jgi:hypothetical protein